MVFYKPVAGIIPAEMEPTPDVKRLINIYVKKCHRVMKIRKDYPDVILDVMRLGRPTGKESLKTYYGQLVIQKPDQRDLLFLNIPKHVNKNQLRDTILHEYIHYKHPKLHHGKVFNELARQLYDRL
jgi:hypothetical protein